MKTVLYFFGILNDDDISWLAGNGQMRTLARGEVLIRKGVEVAQLFILLSGRARVVGSDKRLLAMVGRGDMLGEMSFVEQAPPSADVHAETDLLVLAIDTTRMRAHLDGEAAFAARFYRALSILLSHRLRAAQLGSSANGLDRDELDETALDTVSMAGTRFNDLLKALGQA